MTQRYVDHAFYPDRAGPIGLMLFQDDAGERRTIMVDGDYLRSLEANAVADPSGPLQINSESPNIMPGFVPGWPDDWSDEVRAVVKEGADAVTEHGWRKVQRAATAQVERPTKPTPWIFPCPRCGGEAQLERDRVNSVDGANARRYYGSCKSCGRVLARNVPIRVVDGLSCLACGGRLTWTNELDTPDWEECRFFCAACRSLAKFGARPLSKKLARTVAGIQRTDHKLQALTISGELYPEASRSLQRHFTGRHGLLLQARDRRARRLKALAADRTAFEVVSAKDLAPPC
jgi:transcription elongation factor Elf1